MTVFLVSLFSKFSFLIVIAQMHVQIEISQNGSEKYLDLNFIDSEIHGTWRLSDDNLVSLFLEEL